MMLVFFHYTASCTKDNKQEDGRARGEGRVHSGRGLFYKATKVEGD